MVNIDVRLAEIKGLVDEKQYFVINRARQYGKTTTLNQLVNYLSDKYTLLVLRDWEHLLLKANQHFVILYAAYCMIQSVTMKFLH